MIVPVHAVVGLGLARFFNIPWYFSLLFSTIPDIDHLFFIHTWRFKQGGFASSRTFIHEILGLAIWGGIGLMLTVLIPEWGRPFLVCISLHMLLDFVDGKSIPYRHLRTEQPVDMGIKPWVRVVQQVAVTIIFIVLFLTWEGRPFLRW